MTRSVKKTDSLTVWLSGSGGGWGGGEERTRAGWCYRQDNNMSLWLICGRERNDSEARQRASRKRTQFFAISFATELDIELHVHYVIVHIVYIALAPHILCSQYRPIIVRCSRSILSPTEEIRLHEYFFRDANMKNIYFHSIACRKGTEKQKTFGVLRSRCSKIMKTVLFLLYVFFITSFTMRYEQIRCNKCLLQWLFHEIWRFAIGNYVLMVSFRIPREHMVCIRHV